MKFPNVTGLLVAGKNIVTAHRPELMLAASVTATLGAVVLAAKGGYKAHEIVAAEEVILDRETTVKEKIQLTWLCYAPAAITTVGALGSITGLHLIHVKEKKALAASALMAADEIKKYATELTDEYHEENANEEGVSTIVDTDGEIEELYLVRDARTGRDIWSNKTRIEDAVLETNNIINGSGEVDLNSFYGYAGFGSVPDGLDYGWAGVFVVLKWSTISRDDGRPVKMFEFRTTPEKGYDSVMG